MTEDMDHGNTGVETSTATLISEEDYPDFRSRVENAIEKIRPALAMDGGDCRFVDATKNGDVIIEFQGACQGCAMTTMTLKLGIEQALKDEIPEVRTVIALNE